MTTKTLFKKIGGGLTVALAIFAGIVVFPAHINDKSWNAAPFVFAEAALFVMGFSWLFTKDDSLKVSKREYELPESYLPKNPYK